MTSKLKASEYLVLVVATNSVYVAYGVRMSRLLIILYRRRHRHDSIVTHAISRPASETHSHYCRKQHIVHNQNIPVCYSCLSADSSIDNPSYGLWSTLGQPARVVGRSRRDAGFRSHLVNPTNGA